MERVRDLQERVRELERKVAELTALYAVSQALSMSFLTDRLLTVVGAIFADAFGASGFALYILREGRLELAVLYRRDEPSETGGREQDEAVVAPFLQELLSARQAARLDRSELGGRWPDAPLKGAEVLVVPLASEVVSPCGLLVVAHDEPIDVTREALYRRVAEQVAVAVENALALEEAQRQSGTDVLTGLPNRRYLDDRAERELARADRYGRVLSLAVLDLDRFKQINDTLGHEAGDRVLRRVGELLRSGIRTADVVGRYGGDEFLLLFPETGKQAALVALEKLARRLAEDLELQRLGGGVVAFSAGVATYPEDARRFRDLFRKADRALYAAKRAGRGRVVAAGDVWRGA